MIGVADGGMVGVRVGLVRSGRPAGVGSRLAAKGELLSDCVGAASRPNGDARKAESDVRTGLNNADCVSAGAARSTGRSSSSSLSERIVHCSCPPSEVSLTSGRIVKCSSTPSGLSDLDGDDLILREGDPVRTRSKSPDPERGKGAK